MSEKMLFFCFLALCVVFTYGRQFQTKDKLFIDSLQQYEFVDPDLSEPLTLESSNRLLVAEEKRLLSFSFRGQTLKIRLTLNRNLLSPNFFERYVTKHGYEIVNETPHNCHFQGHVEGYEGVSVAAISTCDGFEGYFSLKKKTYLIQPVKALNGKVFHLLFESKHLNLPEYKCGHGDSENSVLYENIVENVTLAHHRVRRDVLSETKYVELIMVNDKGQYEKYGSNTSTRAITAVNIADSSYRVHNVRVVLTMIEIWKDANQISYSNNNDVFLKNFVKYKQTVLDKNETTKNDHAVLITQTRLANGLTGYAGTLTICSHRSASLVYDEYSSTSYFATIVAHELGHSFGFKHDNVKECSCGGDKYCLMSPTASEGPLKFSNCSQEQLKTTLRKNYGTCLFNQPKKFYRHVQCGNGFIDQGEECDCGTKEHCEELGNRCCNHTTCQLYPRSECSDGPCCENCQIRPKGSLCRDKVNDCDLPEYCDGESTYCAPDSYVHNGRPCTFEKETSLCYLGVCHTYDYQCKRYWGPDGFFSVPCSKKLNPFGSQVGFCKRFSNGTFTKCAKEDVKCGKLYCEMTKQVNDRMPLFGPVKYLVQFGKYRCWSFHLKRAYPEFGLDIGMVQTGSMCAENKVCYDNACMDVNKVYKQPDCPNNCSGNGVAIPTPAPFFYESYLHWTNSPLNDDVCNNLGHCHCNHGYGCPNCSEKCDSDGGSIDSGNNCYCPGPNISTTVITTQPNVSTTVVTPRTNFNTTVVTTIKGDKDKTGKSEEIVKIVSSVVFGVILIVSLLLCFIFRTQISERIRKIRPPQTPIIRKKSSEPRVRYLSDENIGENERDLDVNTYENMRINLWENIGEKNPGFTSLSFMPESKIDSKHVPSNSTSSPLSHDVPPEPSKLSSDQSSISNPSYYSQMNGKTVPSTHSSLHSPTRSAIPNTPDSPKTADS